MPGKIQEDQYATVFWAKVEKTDTCWLWKGSKHSGRWPYGKVKYQGRCVYTHRVAWILTFGEIPYDQKVLHNCPGGDNPTCVNPAHLWTGTLKENTQDAVSKGKYVTQWTQAEERCGEANPVAKLTILKVLDARKRAQNGEPFASIARDLEVSAGAISRAVRGKTWRSIAGL
jgi:hypothetical protein